MNIAQTSILLTSAAFAMTLGVSVAQADADLEFIQWWEPELPAGALRGIMDEFEAQNPGITVTLVSGPYSSTRDQIVVGAASGTLSDVVGLDGAWVNDLAKQGAIAPMDGLMEGAGFDSSEVAAIISLDGNSYMFPVASFVYPIFVNLDLMADAGLENPPTTRSEFV
ncbi:MAG: extracellular solute-binding protein, partial [Alphaproteobacteria bacterium]|nr:extracellular solute-binding protein [Alphaproteobacteria bacterium]